MSRGKGASAVAKAAYISGEKIKNQYDSKIHDYRKKNEVVHKEILLPTNAPPKFRERSVLWNTVELAETRKKVPLCSAAFFIISLPPFRTMIPILSYFSAAY